MNTILPTGVSRLNTASSKFNLESGSVIIGLNAGTQLQEIDNVFIGNNAGADSTYVSESVFLGIYAGQYVRTGKKSIIIGHDKSSTYLNKTNTLSIGFNSIERESIGIGTDITSTGSNNVLVGQNILSASPNSFGYGKNLNIQNSTYFIDTMNAKNTQTLLDGFNKIGLINIETSTDIYTCNLFYLQYDINNSIKTPDTLFNKESDIILKFKPKKDMNFSFSIGFYISSCNMVNFSFTNNMIYYTNNEVILDLPINYNIAINNAYIYDEYNTIHIINNDKTYKTLSIYINPTYNGYTIKNTSKNYNDLGFMTNIKNNNINNIRISYSLADNKINSNYIFSETYKTIYDTSSNYRIIDYYSFKNASESIMFDSLIMCINDTSKDIYNITYGRDINVKGTNNICIGDKQNVVGDSSILIGNNISAVKTYKDSKNSIVIGNENFMNTYCKDVILIGNNNFNDLASDDAKYAEFLGKQPVVIGLNISNYDFPLNIDNTIVKYDVNSNQMMFLGMQDNHLPVAIGFSSNTTIPLPEFYKFEYQSNIHYEYETSNVISNYFIDGILYQETESYVITHELMDIQITNNIVFNEDRHALYVKKGIYSDALALYNSSNYNIHFKTDEKIKQNIKYILPDVLEAEEYNTKTPILSYRSEGNSNALYWKTLEQTLRTIDIYSKNIISDGYIYSSDFVGVGSNLKAINLDDRDTSLLQEGSNLYYTAQRVGTIAHASNVKAMNYTLAASNEILHIVQDLTTHDIAESGNLYYTNSRFDERFLSKTLDNIYNGTSNKFITNDIYTNNLLITGTLTVGKIQVLGIDFPNAMDNTGFASAADVAVLSEQIRNLAQAVARLEANQT